METPLWQKPAQQMLDEQKSTKMKRALQGNPGGRTRSERLLASLVNLDGTAIFENNQHCMINNHWNSLEA